MRRMNGSEGCRGRGRSIQILGILVLRLIRGSFCRRRLLPGPHKSRPPVSADGSEGFFLLVKGGSVISCDLKSVTFSGDAPRGSKAGLAAIRIFTTDKDLIQGYFDEKNHVFDRSLVPPNVVVDEGLRESFQNDTLTLTLKDQRIYPQEGAPWYVTVSGTITFRCDKASIAPGKKAP
jgi:hypothetical protein